MTRRTYAPRRSITKTVSLACDPQAAFRFLANAAKWPLWAIVNVNATWPMSDGDWWEMDTPHGRGRLRLRVDARTGVLDQDFIDPQAQWTVPARVVANGTGAEFIITFFQPPNFTDSLFDEQIKLVDRELAKLKEILEAEANAQAG